MSDEARSTERKRTGQLSGIQIMFAAILAIGLILAINFSTRIAAGQPVQEEYDRIEQEIDALRLEQGALITERDYARSDAYVEDWARDDGKMVRPGEVLVIPVPAGEGIEATPVPQLSVEAETRPPQPENWMLWWSLFFDTPPPEF